MIGTHVHTYINSLDMHMHKKKRHSGVAVKCTSHIYIHVGTKQCELRTSVT